ncbi:MAG: polysaccharide deacetylase family protein [Phaeodactylibacter sp.]|uniref:polysaccharide deacetylase family protein n=1 Tax=Phaeodactylibacter sp. TaxID=1940289 RepID=UPI0032F0621D
MKLLVYTAQPTKRASYACRVLFECILGMPVEMTNNWSRFLSADTLRMIYGRPPARSGLPWLPCVPLLRETGVHPIPYTVRDFDQRPAACFVPDSASALLPFDLLAFTFLLVTRYEEYLPFQSDQHGRFPATASLAHRYGFLHRPVLQEWGAELWKRLKAHYPTLPDHRPRYQFRPTYDVDMAWAYRYRPLWRQLAGLARDTLTGNTRLIRERIGVLRSKTNDPFYTFAELERLHREYDLHPIFFVLLGMHGPYDKNLPPEGQPMQALIADLARQADTGLHPSYRSNEHPEALQAEVQHFARLTGQPPLRSRQHFLKLSFPATYRQLIQAGIQEDYTMGYADATGFRAGLAVPYPWYDLEAESEQPLTLYPFVLMDVTLKQYLHLSSEGAIAEIRALVSQIKATGGLFIPLWHNSSFAKHHGWAGWDKVHETLLQYGKAES